MCQLKTLRITNLYMCMHVSYKKNYHLQGSFWYYWLIMWSLCWEVKSLSLSESNEFVSWLWIKYERPVFVLLVVNYFSVKSRKVWLCVEKIAIGWQFRAFFFPSIVLYIFILLMYWYWSLGFYPQNFKCHLRELSGVLSWLYIVTRGESLII